MTSLRTRFRQYQTVGDIPETPEWHDGVGRGLALFGTAIVVVVGLLATIPFTVVALVGYAVVSPSGLLAPAYVVVSGLVLALLANRLGLYLGGPIADHVLGVPREVSP